MKIEPTIGRIVHYHPEPDMTHAAIVTHIWSDTCVNLSVFDNNGNQYPCTSVFLFQDEPGAERPSHSYAEWMPYQKGQAAKKEALEAELSKSNGYEVGAEEVATV